MSDSGPTHPEGGDWADGLGALHVGRLVLDRRRFLRLVAASGLAAAGAGVVAPAAWGQSRSPSAGSVDPIADLAARLGHDHERIFAFVRDEVRYAPYVGSLRGAEGTLRARAGNSVDQALLLAELLRQGDRAVRFVSGSLDASVAEAIEGSMRMDARAAIAEARLRAFAEEDLDSGLTWVSDAAVVPAEITARLPTLDQLATELDAGWSEVEAIAADQLDRAIQTILAGLADVGVSIPASASMLPEREIRRHTWLQASDGSGGWVDLDPSDPEAAVGDAPGAAGEPVEVVPDSERHRVTIRVLSETYWGGALSRAPLLSVSWFADQLRDVGLMFSHVPSETLGSDIDILGGVGEGSLYSPVVFAGSDAYVGERAVVIGGGGGGGGLFGGALGGGGGGLVDGETTAEWVEVVVSSPDAEPLTARRALFDRIGPSVRELGALDPTSVPPAELTDLGDGMGAHYLPCRAVRAFHVSCGPVNAKAMIEGVALKGTSVGSLLAGAFGLYRDIHGADLAAPTGWRPVIVGPSVVSWDFESTMDGFRTGPDLWHRASGAVELAGASPTVPAAIVAGIVPHVIERASVGDAGPETPATAGGLSVGNIFDRAAAAGIPIRAFRGALPSDSGYEEHHRHSIAEALGAGQVVIVPERAIDVAGRPRLGWWLVDPHTGATMDQLDDGRQAAEQIPTHVLVATALLRAGPFAMMGAGQAAQYGPRFYWLWYQLMQDVQQLRNLGGG